MTPFPALVALCRTEIQDYTSTDRVSERRLLDYQKIKCERRQAQNEMNEETLEVIRQNIRTNEEKYVAMGTVDQERTRQD